jgi:50S ribosomal protein L16 3-hydroxylase
MFTEWLRPLSLEDFSARCLGRQPLAQPGTADAAIPLLDWRTLDRVLQSPVPLDMMTVARGLLVDTPPPRSLAEVRRLMDRGVSVVIRASERHDPALAELAAAVSAAVPGELHIQIYATPGGTNSYGWHYDFEHVFIAQTAGVKDYYFRDNTVARDTVLGDALDFTPVQRETAPLFTAQLHAGDMLYIPPRWWHLVRCREDSLSLSVGVMPPEAFQTARRIPAGWTGWKRG